MSDTASDRSSADDAEIPDRSAMDANGEQTPGAAESETPGEATTVRSTVSASANPGMPRLYWFTASLAGAILGVIVGITAMWATAGVVPAVMYGIATTIAMFVATVSVAAVGWRLGRRDASSDPAS